MTRATLVSAAVPGAPADQLLAGCARREATALAARIARFVSALHRAGFRDRNLDLRNLLIDGEQIYNIDSPRHRIVKPDSGDDRWRRADWDRLLPQLATFGVREVAERAR